MRQDVRDVLARERTSELLPAPRPELRPRGFEEEGMGSGRRFLDPEHQLYHEKLQFIFDAKIRFHRRPMLRVRVARNRMSRAEHFLLGLTVGVWSMAILWAVMAWSAR